MNNTTDKTQNPSKSVFHTVSYNVLTYAYKRLYAARRGCYYAGKIGYSHPIQDVSRGHMPYTAGRVNIVVLHGQIASVSGVDQVNLKRIQGENIDYLALGHIHSHSAEKLDSAGYYCYPGCLEGRGFDECGEKGFILLDITNGRLTALARQKSLRIELANGDL